MFLVHDDHVCVCLVCVSWVGFPFAFAFGIYEEEEVSRGVPLMTGVFIFGSGLGLCHLLKCVSATIMCVCMYLSNIPESFVVDICPVPHSIFQLGDVSICLYNL